MGTFVALLRGINVSGHNPIAMKDLRAMFLALPAEDVTTYLQSGNVVFQAPTTDPSRLGRDIGELIKSHFGLDVMVVVRPGEDLARVAAGNPFPTEDQLHVTFLAQSPDPARMAALAPPPGTDSFHLGLQEVYLSCPNGYGRTKLNNAFFEKRLAVTATTRNWRTVTTLAEMARGLPPRWS